MNVKTGELFRIDPEIEKELAERFFSRNEDVKLVPDALSEEAEKELGDKNRVLVDMEKGTSLVNWAKSQQTQVHTGSNRKQRRRMAKENRRKNRR